MRQKLIDVNKLMLSLADWKLQETPILTDPTKPKEFTADDMQRMIWRTIRDCESAVEEQPEVEAVPIDWIKDYMLRLPDGSEAYECILIMLEEWKRDSGIEEESDERLEKLSDILRVFPKLQGLIMDVLEEKKND